MQQHKSRILIGAAIAAVLVVLGSVAHLAAKPKPVSVAAAAPTPARDLPLPPPAAPPAPAAEPVLYKNPFDRSEVFEFPAGTTQAEARDAVAKLLMDRAHDRGPDVLKLKIHKVHASKALVATAAPRSDRPNLQVSASAQTASLPADHR